MCSATFAWNASTALLSPARSSTVERPASRLTSDVDADAVGHVVYARAQVRLGAGCDGGDVIPVTDPVVQVNVGVDVTVVVDGADAVLEPGRRGMVAAAGRRDPPGARPVGTGVEARGPYRALPRQCSRLRWRTGEEWGGGDAEYGDDADDPLAHVLSPSVRWLMIAVSSGSDAPSMTFGWRRNSLTAGACGKLRGGHRDSLFA